VRLLLLDVDGVLTDAGVYVGEGEDGRPVELKRFDIQDGVGILLLRESGIEVALVSGRVSPATTLRAEELGLECHQDAGAQKLPAVRGMLERKGLDWSQVAMLGDDLPDLAVLRRVGLPAAVGNAVEEVRREAVWVGRRSGGRGAVREFARALLDARGEWEQAVEAYVAARSSE
jgi:3-deoxy-D-manno-octulosonate 8-phosphate phosphatase (KDO 8-P phosphatase)